MSTKILLDTDIGSDIDDALCLAYLLAQTECELLGITTVTGEAVKRAMLASVLCKIADRTVPIFPGIEQPLLGPIQQPHAPQAVALEKWDHDTIFPRGQAIEFLRHMIRRNPGEIVLVGIGPLTNIALLFAVDPEIPTLLKGLVLMCGLFTAGIRYKDRVCEWNALNDPHATAMVYRAPVGSHRSLGLDVTTQVKMDAEQFRAKCSVPLLQPVLDFAEVWFKQRDTIIFHDPLAAAAIFDQSICTFTPGRVDIELKNEQEYGRTHWYPYQPPLPHEVALEVDPARFFTHYFGIFEQKN